MRIRWVRDTFVLCKVRVYREKFPSDLNNSCYKTTKTTLNCVTLQFKFNNYYNFKLSLRINPTMKFLTFTVSPALQFLVGLHKSAPLSAASRSNKRTYRYSESALELSTSEQKSRSRFKFQISISPVILTA